MITSFIFLISLRPSTSLISHAMPFGPDSYTLSPVLNISYLASSTIFPEPHQNSTVPSRHKYQILNNRPTSVRRLIKKARIVVLLTFRIFQCDVMARFFVFSQLLLHLAGPITY